MNYAWYEVWADEGHEVPYLLLLRPSEAKFEILDPAQGNRRVHQTTDYQEACFWLLEDEFVRVGRKSVDNEE